MEPLMAATFDSLPAQRIFVDARKHAYTPLTPSQNASACGGDTWPRYIALLRSGMPNWVLNKYRPERLCGGLVGNGGPHCHCGRPAAPCAPESLQLLQYPLACMHALPESIFAL